MAERVFCLRGPNKNKMQNLISFESPSSGSSGQFLAAGRNHGGFSCRLRRVAAAQRPMADVGEDIEEIEEEYDDDFDDDDEDEGSGSAATAKPEAQRAASIAERTAVAKEKEESDRREDETRAPGETGATDGVSVPSEPREETLEERIQRKQNEAIAARRQANVVAGDEALESTRNKLKVGDIAGARTDFTNALKAFRAGGVVKPELQQLGLDISEKESEAAQAAEKAREEEAAAAAAAKAAAFKAEAEAAARLAKEAEEAKRAAEAAAQAEAEGIAAAKAKEEEDARIAREAALAEAKVEEERKSAAALFAEKKRDEKAAKQAAEAASSAHPENVQLPPGDKDALMSTPMQSSFLVDPDEKFLQFVEAKRDEDSKAATLAESAGSDSTGDLTRRERKATLLRETRPTPIILPTSPLPNRTGPGQRFESSSSITAQAGSSHVHAHAHAYARAHTHTHTPDGNARTSTGNSPCHSPAPFSSSTKSVPNFQMMEPEPELWAALLSHLEDAGDASICCICCRTRSACQGSSPSFSRMKHASQDSGMRQRVPR